MKNAASTALIAAIALTSSHAFAEDYNSAKSVCADAIALKQGKSLEGARTKLVSASNRAVLRVKVALTYADGSDVKGECRIRRGEIQSVEIAA